MGIGQIELAPGGLGGYWGASATDSLYGSGAMITVRFDLYAPLAAGGDGCHSLYEALCDRLLLRKNAFGFLRLTCGEVGFDKGASANRLTALGTLRTALMLRDESVPIREFTVLRKPEKE